MTLELGYIVVAIYNGFCWNSVAYNAACVPDVVAEVGLILQTPVPAIVVARQPNAAAYMYSTVGEVGFSAVRRLRSATACFDPFGLVQMRGFKSSEGDAVF